MNDIPSQSCRKLSHESNRHIPFFTVVTDLGSGHCTWFEKNVEKMFIASQAIEKLAIERGKVPRDKLVMSGLPIRCEFAIEAERLGERTTLEGKIYQLQMRGYLGLIEDSPSSCGHVEDVPCVSDCEDSSDRKVLLVMGGGEGVGSLSTIVHNLYVHCVRHNIRALILVVCGRNVQLKSSLETCDWDGIYEQEILSLPQTNDFVTMKEEEQIMSPSQLQQPTNVAAAESRKNYDKVILEKKQNGTSSIASKVAGVMLSPFKIVSSVSSFTKKETSNSLSTLPTKDTKDTEDQNCTRKQQQQKSPYTSPSTTLEEEKKDSYCDNDDHDQTSSPSISSTESSTTSISPSQPQSSPLIIVKPLGFVTNMAEYMVAADLLLTKAGPGTIAEAASLGLPVLLTSFLPGQEEGNIDFVIEKKFGEYISDSKPELIAKTVCSWLNNPDKMKDMSQHASMAGMPNAAEDIVKCIGKSVLRWKESHEEVRNED